VYGPGQRPKAGFGVIANGFERIRRQEPIQIWGDGTATRDYLYIDDFIDLCVRVISEHAGLGFDVMNAASGIGVSLNHLMDLMEEAAGKPLIREFRERRPLDAPHVVIASSKALLRYGWSAATPLRTGLERTWNWLSTLHP
jgi:UDP-glucose 4-epimerase